MERINSKPTYSVEQKYQTINQGKRISTSDLINFINKNSSIINSIGCVDLNNTNKNTQDVQKTISPLKFQDIQKITFLPKNLSKIFDIDNKYLHIGVLRQFSEHDHRNISIFSAILSCLKQSYTKQQMTYQSNLILNLIDRLKKESQGKNFNKFGYNKYKWDKQNLLDTINKCSINKYLLKYLSDYFHVNIFILNLNNDYIEFGSDVFIPYKKNIFLLCHQNNNFEPLITENNRIFNNDDTMIKYFIKNPNSVRCYSMKQNDDDLINFTIHTEDLSSYLIKITTNLKEKKLTYKEKIENEQKEISKIQKELDNDKKAKKKLTKESSDDSNFSDNSKSNKKSKKNKTPSYDNMKLSELKDLAKEKNITLTEKVDGKTKQKSKQQLIDEIKSK